MLCRKTVYTVCYVDTSHRKCYENMIAMAKQSTINKTRFTVPMKKKINNNKNNNEIVLETGYRVIIMQLVCTQNYVIYTHRTVVVVT